MKQVEEKLELEEPVELILEEGGGELELEEKDEEEEEGKGEREGAGTLTHGKRDLTKAKNQCLTFSDNRCPKRNS